MIASSYVSTARCRVCCDISMSSVSNMSDTDDNIIGYLCLYSQVKMTCTSPRKQALPFLEIGADVYVITAIKVYQFCFLAALHQAGVNSFEWSILSVVKVKVQ